MHLYAIYVNFIGRFIIKDPKEGEVWYMVGDKKFRIKIVQTKYGDVYYNDISCDNTILENLRGNDILMFKSIFKKEV